MLLLGVTPCSATGAQAEVLGYASHADWASFAVPLSPVTRYRASTVFVEQGSYVTLNVDRLPSACETSYISMTVTLDGLLGDSVDQRDARGVLRVDEDAPHTITFSAQGKRGGGVLVLSLSDLDDRRAAIDALAAGAVVRMKLPAAGKDYYFHFSLRGFTDALQRSRAWCERHGSVDDRRYFDPPVGNSENAHPIERF